MLATSAAKSSARLLCTVTPAVARAAIESGVARQLITDWDAYIEKLRTMTEI